MTDGRHTGTGGGNHFVMGGATPADCPVPAQARAAGQPAAVLAQPSVAELPVLGHVHRPDQPGAAGGRGAQRPALRAGDRAAAKSQRNREIHGAEHAAVAGGPHAAQHPGRRHRQHPPQRVLHRQALLARLQHRPAGPARTARLRDAAACAHEHRAAIADARIGRALLERSPIARPSRAGARSCTTASCCRPSSRWTSTTSWPICAKRASPSMPTWFAPHFEFRFPLVGQVQSSGHRADAAQCARALARDGRGRLGRRHGALCRFVAGAHRGARHRPEREPLCHHRERQGDADAAHRHRRRVRGRRALQGLDSALGAASDHRRACAADLRHRRHLDEAVRWAAASTTWRIRAGATTTPSRSTPTRPKAVASRASSAWAIRPGRCSVPPATIERARAAASSRSRWTCAGRRWGRCHPALDQRRAGSGCGGLQALRLRLESLATSHRASRTLRRCDLRSAQRRPRSEHSRSRTAAAGSRLRKTRATARSNVCPGRPRRIVARRLGLLDFVAARLRASSTDSSHCLNGATSGARSELCDAPRNPIAICRQVGCACSGPPFDAPRHCPARLPLILRHSSDVTNFRRAKSTRRLSTASVDNPVG